MPSAFAHAFVGASLASLLARPSRRAWVVGGLALLAAAPDLDVIGLRLGIPYEHPLGHRGLSHSLLFAALIGGASLPLWRRTLPRDSVAAATLTFLAVASHGVFDAFTDAGLGVGLLIPLDNARYFAPWRPILTSPLAVGAFFSDRGLAVLANEAIWMGIPAALLLLAGSVHRAVRHSWAAHAPDGTRKHRQRQADQSDR